MMSLSPKRSFWVGWDVGGWNCDKHANSRDAVVILDETLRVAGAPWRGNLRSTFNAAKDTPDFLSCLFALCGVPVPPKRAVSLSSRPDAAVCRKGHDRQSGDQRDACAGTICSQEHEMRCWSDGDALAVIEAYPAACRRSGLIQEMSRSFQDSFKGRHDGEKDALTCALIAALHSTRANVLIPLPSEVPAS